MHKPSRTKSRPDSSIEAIAQADIAEVQEVLGLGSLKAEERRVRVHTFRPEDLPTDSSFWAKTFNGMQPRCMSPLPKKPDLIVGATGEEFVLCLRQGLTIEQRSALLRHGAAHIILGHIRLGDYAIHADSLEQLSSRPTRRWDAQVEAFLSHLASVRPPSFTVQGLTEALARLVSGDLDPAMTSALLLLQSYADELVEVPEALNERAHLFPHQQRGLAELAARLRRFNVAILADSVGLGKTRLACALVRTLKNTGQLSQAAIVTPRKLERNWRKEMAVVSLEEGEDVVLVNKDMLKRWTPEESARVFRGCGLVIVEEAHQDLRNPGNRFHRNLRDGVGLAPGLLVTATPWNNRRGDIFAILSPFVRPAPGAGDGAFQCFKKGFRTGRREFEESDEVFRKVYELTVLQRTRRQLRELGDAGVFYAPRAPSLDVVPYSEEHQQAFRKLLGVVEALRLPYFNPVRFLTGERDAEWRLSGTHRFFLLKRAESSMAAFRVTLQGMQERSERLREELQNVDNHEDAIARWLAGTYRIAEDVVEATLDVSLEGGLLEERVTRPRQRRILRLIEEARNKGRLRALRKRLCADCEADIQLLHDIERDFQDLFTADPKLSLVQRLVGERLGEHRKVLLVSQFADTAFAVYRVLCAHARVAGSGIGLVMSTAKGGEAPVQVNGREATRDEVLRRFAPQAWAQNAIESGFATGRNGTSAVDEISVLVGTDTISVGQNLQDARTILHLDLTWNPMVLEQRIGRLDRPRHESDNEPIEIRYFLNLDLIEAELQLKKKIEARLEATYRDTAFDDEILPGYFELIEKMRQLRAERADAAEIAREVDALVEELAATRPTEVSSNGVEARRVALERLRETCDGMPVPDPLPPLSVTLGTSGSGRIECAAQVEFQALDNNEHPIGPPESRLIWLRQEGNTVTSGMEDLPMIVEVVLSPERPDRLPTVDAQKALEMLDREVQRFATAIKEERNRLREKRREVIERTRPPWLGPLVRKLRGFLERLPEEQYSAFLTRWEITDEGLSRWLDTLTTGIDLDDADLVEQVRRLETAPAAILDAFGIVKDVVASDDETSTPSAQLELALEPVVHRIEARLKSLRINLPTQQPVQTPAVSPDARLDTRASKISSKDLWRVTPIESILAELLEGIRPLLGSREPTQNLLEEALASIMMDRRIKELLGRQAAGSGARESSDAEQRRALLAALSAGLYAQSDQEVAVAAECLQAEFSALVSSRGKKWLAFIPLTGTHSGQTRVFFGLETMEVPCAILPALSGTARARALQEMAQRCEAATPGPDESQLQQVTFVSVCSGTPGYAVQEAVARLAVVRDAMCYAHLVTAGAPGFGPGANHRYDANAIRRHEVLLCPMAGGTPCIEPVWSTDVSLDVDAVIHRTAQWRRWYDRAVRLLVMLPETHTAGASPTVGLRLTRSIRVMSRASSQSNSDLRFLLCLVALETLVSFKDQDIAQSVADIGARVMTHDAAERHKVFRYLKEAYDIRSRFVHAGEIPSLVIEASRFKQSQSLVLTVWCEVSRRFFDLVDRGLTEKQLSTSLDEFRGIAQFKYGAPWEEAFSHAGDPAEREDVT